MNFELDQIFVKEKHHLLSRGRKSKELFIAQIALFFCFFYVMAAFSSLNFEINSLGLAILVGILRVLLNIYFGLIFVFIAIFISKHPFFVEQKTQWGIYLMKCRYLQDNSFRKQCFRIRILYWASILLLSLIVLVFWLHATRESYWVVWEDSFYDSDESWIVVLWKLIDIPESLLISFVFLYTSAFASDSPYASSCLYLTKAIETNDKNRFYFFLKAVENLNRFFRPASISLNLPLLTNQARIAIAIDFQEEPNHFKEHLESMLHGLHESNASQTAQALGMISKILNESLAIYEKVLRPLESSGDSIMRFIKQHWYRSLNWIVIGFIWIILQVYWAFEYFISS